MINGVWQFNGYTYTAFSGTDLKAEMASPANGSTLPTGNATFTWNTGSGASQYALWAGTNPDTYNLYAFAEGWNLTDTLTSLPQDGTPVYVNLWSMINGIWQANKYIYKSATPALPPKALMSSPTNASLLNSATLTLNWNAGNSATWYAIWVGSSPNTYDIYAAVEGTKLTDTLQVPLDGRRIYVTLWSYINNTWQPVSYYYDTTQ
jgi:hypothetical protein